MSNELFGLHLVGRYACAEKGRRMYEVAGGAVAALKPAAISKCGPQVRDLLRQAFHSRNRSPNACCKGQTRKYRYPFNQDGAGSAFAASAGLLSAFQSELVSQDLEKSRVPSQIYATALAVDY
jgi:hypothetical protein